MRVCIYLVFLYFFERTFGFLLLFLPFVFDLVFLLFSQKKLIYANFFSKEKTEWFFSSIIKRIIDNNIIKTSFCFTCGVVTKKFLTTKKFRKKILRVNDWGGRTKKTSIILLFLKREKKIINFLEKKICSWWFLTLIYNRKYRINHFKIF